MNAVTTFCQDHRTTLSSVYKVPLISSTGDVLQLTDVVSAATNGSLTACI